MAHELTDDTSNGHHCQLMATPNQTGKQYWIDGRSEDIAMDLLPAILITNVSLLEQGKEKLTNSQKKTLNKTIYQ